MIEKLKRSRDFTTIYDKSKKVYTRYAIVFVSENKKNIQRFGFVASKKTGNAVQRNRIKRLFREFVKNNKENKKESTNNDDVDNIRILDIYSGVRKYRNIC